jgi:hypothetical protein
MLHHSIRTSMKPTTAEIALVRAAASLAAHAPEKMRAAHMASRLEALAKRMQAELPPARDETPPLQLPRAA